MWLLKLHFSISILLILAYIGLKAVFKDRIKSNLCFLSNKKEKHQGFLKRTAGNIRFYLLLLCPIMNVIMMFVLFVIAIADKQYLQKFKEEMEKGQE